VKIALLTTDTIHHAFFAAQLASAHQITGIVLETRPYVPPFPTGHVFENERDEVEARRWFDGTPSDISAYGSVTGHETINDKSVLEILERSGADAFIVFGTSRIRRPVIDLCGSRLVNLHGGDPERYRGLDSHLWAIYHRDFPGLVTTLHRVNPVLDDGEIVAQEKVPLSPCMRISELRAINTEVCVALALRGLKGLADTGEFICRKQQKKGRYYSCMPSVLKDSCVRNFDQHVASL